MKCLFWNVYKQYYIINTDTKCVYCGQADFTKHKTKKENKDIFIGINKWILILGEIHIDTSSFWASIYLNIYITMKSTVCSNTWSFSSI